jgi:hypothetical protein
VLLGPMSVLHLRRGHGTVLCMRGAIRLLTCRLEANCYYWAAEILIWPTIRTGGWPPGSAVRAGGWNEGDRKRPTFRIALGKSLLFALFIAQFLNDPK